GEAGYGQGRRIVRQRQELAGAGEGQRAVGINPCELGRVIERLLRPRPRGTEIVNVAVSIVGALDDEPRAVRRDRMTDAASVTIDGAVVSGDELRPGVADANR